MTLLMLEDITNDGSCSKGDVIVAKYLYDGKYQLLHKYTDEKKLPIEMQCYSHQCIELATTEDIQKALDNKVFENTQNIETFEYIAKLKNRGMQVLAHKNDDISIIIRNNQNSVKRFKITVEEMK